MRGEPQRQNMSARSKVLGKPLTGEPTSDDAGSTAGDWWTPFQGDETEQHVASELKRVQRDKSRTS